MENATMIHPAIVSHVLEHPSLMQEHNGDINAIQSEAQNQGRNRSAKRDRILAIYRERMNDAIGKGNAEAVKRYALKIVGVLDYRPDGIASVFFADSPSLPSAKRNGKPGADNLGGKRNAPPTRRLTVLERDANGFGVRFRLENIVGINGKATSFRHGEKTVALDPAYRGESIEFTWREWIEAKTSTTENAVMREWFRRIGLGPYVDAMGHHGSTGGDGAIRGTCYDIVKKREPVS